MIGLHNLVVTGGRFWIVGKYVTMSLLTNFTYHMGRSGGFLERATVIYICLNNLSLGLESF